MRNDTGNDKHAELQDQARLAGYDDVFRGGEYRPQDLECKCIQCRLAYLEGQDKAFAEMAAAGGR